MEHIDSRLQTSWCGGLFPWTLTFRFLSVFTLCACSSPSCCLFFWYYLPSYWFYCNEWNSFWILCCICYMDKKKKQHEKTEQKHYRCKAEVFFPPAVFFYAVAKGCIFQFLSNLNSDAKLGPRLSALWTQSKFRLIFLRFYQRFSKMELHSPLFLSELYYCSSLYYILRIKLWYCFKVFVHLLSLTETTNFGNDFCS